MKVLTDDFFVLVETGWLVDWGNGSGRDANGDCSTFFIPRTIMTQTPAQQDSHDVPSTVNEVRPSNADRRTHSVLKRRVDDETPLVASAQDPAVDAPVTDKGQSIDAQAQSAAEVATDGGKASELLAGEDDESSRTGLIAFGLSGLSGLTLTGMALGSGHGSSHIVPPLVNIAPVEPTPPVVTTPPVETTPPVATTPPVETAPPVETVPPVETRPPVATTPPVEISPPVENSPPVETTRPIDVPSGDVGKDTFAVAPTLTLANDTGKGGDRLTNDGTISVGGIEPNATWEYRIDGGGWLAGGASGIADTGFTDGAHSVVARQTDAAGNLSQETELNFSIDKSAPDGLGVFLNADSGIVGDRIIQNANLRVLGTEIGGTTRISVDGALWGTAPNQPDTTIIDMNGLSEGARSIGVQQVDAAGNASAWSSINVTIDRTAPKAEFTGLSGSGLAVTSDEGGEVFLVRDTMSPSADLADIDTLDASSWRSFDSADAGKETSFTDLSGLSAGTYEVYARDGAGNATKIVSPLTGAGTDPLKVLIGSAGADVISLPDDGGVVAGNGGADRFVFKAGQTGTFMFTDIDDQTIRGEADMDVLDLSAVLKNYSSSLTGPNGDAVVNDLFIKRVNEADKSTIFVDVDGSGDFQNADLVLVLTGPAAHQFVQLATPGQVLIA